MISVPATARIVGRFIQRIPVALRPLILIVPLVIAFHQMGSIVARLWPPEFHVKGSLQELYAPTIAPEQARELIMRDPLFRKKKSIACPRRIPDRYDEQSRHPLIAALVSRGQARLVNDASRGFYEQIVEITPEARDAFGENLLEMPSEYVLTMARREILAMTMARPPQGYNEPRRSSMRVTFSWRWAPISPGVATILDATSTNGSGSRFEASAFFEKGTEDWRLIELNFPAGDH